MVSKVYLFAKLYIKIPEGIMNNNRILSEWIYASGKKVTTTPATSAHTQVANDKDVYLWSMYLDNQTKGNWMSAEEISGQYEGFVFETAQEAIDFAHNHLRELEDEGELLGKASDYTVEAVAIPISKVSKSTLRFSGL